MQNCRQCSEFSKCILREFTVCCLGTGERRNTKTHQTTRICPDVCSKHRILYNDRSVKSQCESIKVRANSISIGARSFCYYLFFSLNVSHNPPVIIFIIYFHLRRWYYHLIISRYKIVPHIFLCLFRSPPPLFFGIYYNYTNFIAIIF